MANRLAREKSPYLLQHAGNPVDWHPWGAEAFELAKSQDKPVMLSVGYATCHWCHVMAHESFEDEEVAAALNRDYVAIKVDREERPDVDSVYMSVCQALTGAGGWPLTVFLTPDKKPFYAGTYFPKHTAMGRPGFMELLESIARMWRDERQKLLTTGEEIVKALSQGPSPAGQAPDASVLEKAYWILGRSYDHQHGGFGKAPKFPTPHQLGFLLRWGQRAAEPKARDMALDTLSKMRAGGIFDQVGFGFHRYSVDERWLVPHFEKMLYDQALLALAYLEAYQVSGRQSFADTAREIFRYVQRDLTSEEGGFFSAEDADSEGEEGRFYVWTPEQVRGLLGPEQAKVFNRYYGVTNAGNFEHDTSICHRTRSLQELVQDLDLTTAQAAEMLETSRQELLAARAERVRPLLDDKVLTAWNGLMIAALARGAAVLGDEDYLQAAGQAAEFVMTRLGGNEGRLLRRWRQGQAIQDGFLEDYAFFVWGLLELYNAGFDPAHLEAALELTQACRSRFEDEVGGGFFFTGHDGEELIIRQKDSFDGAVPSGNSVMALNLLRLARLTGDDSLERRAIRTLAYFGRQMGEQPVAHTLMLQAVDYGLGPAQEVVVAGEAGGQDTKALLSAARQGFAPSRALLLKNPGPQGERLAALAPFTKDMGPIEGKAAAYVCQGFSCQAPTTDPEELAGILSGE